jgi:signal transduction histidine kinase
VGIVVAAAILALETLVVVFLQRQSPGEAFETIYLLGVVVVSAVWGLGLSVATSLLSAVVFACIRLWPGGYFAPFDLHNGVIVMVFLVVALCTNFVAGRARAREIEAGQRRREAEGAAVKLQESGARLSVLAEQQAALRRVATLVAHGVDPAELFQAVAEEMRRCLDTKTAGLWRFEASGEITLLAAAAEPALLAKLPPVGTRTPIEGDNLASVLLRTGQPARIDDYENAAGPIAARVRQLGVRAAVGAPVIVDGRLWGQAAVASVTPGPMPADTEARLGDFADLLATALANAAAREQLGELAGRQSALRRVATLVARGVEPSELFNAVAEEIVRCLDMDIGAVWRYEPDGSAILMAVSHPPGARFRAVGERMTLEGDSAAARVFRTGGAARIEWLQNAVGTFGAKAREDGVRNAVGAPVIVDGRLWGVAVVASYRSEPPPRGTEERIGDFADLVATALANAATRDELIASRARIVTAADDARRRLERDLHDGAQQRLVSLGLQLRVTEASLRSEQDDLKEQLSGVVSGLTAVSSELQEISRGIHPAILSKGGLGPALKTLARRCTVPVNVDVSVGRRLPEPVEVAAYYVVAEALTNAAKYAQASEVTVCAVTNGANLRLLIQDNGIGGADSRKGSGLIGLKDRVEVLGGHLKITSPPGSGTSVHLTIPVTG